MGWREDAVAEISGLKPHFVFKHGWSPQLIEPGEDKLDLVVALTSKRLGGRVLSLRLRYLPDWQIAGRREVFVDPNDPAGEGPMYWPPAENPGVRSILTQNNPRCICLRGTWGYHSVLHTDRPMGENTLLGLLLELQAVLDE